MTDIGLFQFDLTVLGLSLILGYVLGSIPFGLVLTRAAGLGDVRSIGSGNIGATNVLRTGNKKLAAATLLLDAFKGTLACFIAGYWGMEAGIMAGFGAFIGHLFPVWLRFKGGKGVATYLGVVLGLAPWIGLAFAIVWLAFAFFLRYSSLAALVATLAVPVIEYVTGDPRLTMLFSLMALITWFKHRANISRLINGTESKIGSKG